MKRLMLFVVCLIAVPHETAAMERPVEYLGGITASRLNGGSLGYAGDIGAFARLPFENNADVQLSLRFGGGWQVVETGLHAQGSRAVVAVGAGAGWRKEDLRICASALLVWNGPLDPNAQYMDSWGQTIDPNAGHPAKLRPAVEVAFGTGLRRAEGEGGWLVEAEVAVAGVLDGDLFGHLVGLRVSVGWAVAQASRKGPEVQRETSLGPSFR